MDLGWVLLHPERHEVIHYFVLQNRGGLEYGLVVESSRVLKDFEDDLPGLVHLREFD